MKTATNKIFDLVLTLVQTSPARMPCRHDMGHMADQLGFFNSSMDDDNMPCECVWFGLHGHFN